MPDLVITLMNPPLDRPNSALAPSATTTKSCTASRLKVNAGRWPPRCSPKNGLLKSAPSTETLLWMPFWPPTLISSPSGPCTMATFGVSVVKLKMLRPLFGSPSTASAPSRVALSDVVTSTSGSAGDRDLLELHDLRGQGERHLERLAQPQGQLVLLRLLEARARGR